MTISFYLNLKSKATLLSNRVLNLFERFWRKESINDLNKKIKNNPEDDKLRARLDYENMMFSKACENPYSNNIADIINKMRTEKWY